MTEKGYITLRGITPTYHYYLKDHQGNNRVVIDQSGTVEQVNHYYPFGGLFGEGTATTSQPYKYNGKELDRMHGLDWYDYGARMYDAALGRFHTQDRFTEKYVNMSPYQYAANNPIKFIDVNGDSIWVNSGGQSYYYGHTDQYGYGMYDKTGQLYVGNDKALNAVNKALARLSLGKEGKALVDGLMNSTNNTQIVDRKGAANSADSQKGDYIIWDSQNTNGAPDQNGNTTRDSYVGLGHEMAHVQDVWNGTINNGTWQSTTDAKGNIVNIPYAEIYSTHKENQIRAENGVSLRVSYAKDAYNNPDPSTRIIQAGTSNSIYYQQNGTTNYNHLKKGQVPYKY